MKRLKTNFLKNQTKVEMVFFWVQISKYLKTYKFFSHCTETDYGYGNYDGGYGGGRSGTRGKGIGNFSCVTTARKKKSTLFSINWTIVGLYFVFNHF